MCSLGLVEATRNISTPRWGFEPICTNFVPLRFMETVIQLDHKLALIGTGFPLICEQHDSQSQRDLWVVLQDMAAYTVFLSDYCEARVMDESPGAIADQRNSIHHKLMSLQETVREQSSPFDDRLQEATRVAAIIYSNLVICPMAGAPFRDLAAQLRRALCQLEMHDESLGSLRRMIWILFLGGIAALGTEHRSWFVSMLGATSSRLDLVNMFDAKEILISFLWLPQISDDDARRLWDEVEDSFHASSASFTLSPNHAIGSSFASWQ